ncbi:MAG: DUF63 family protein [Halobacteriales archaeon]|nr:DUF63 family protein [Halobacteriales archaeon]
MRRALAFVLLGLALPLAIVALGVFVRPDVFYDHFLWEHLWGSAVADAGQTGRATWHGISVTDDYTLVAEAVYGILLAVALYGIYRHVIQRFGVKVDAWFIGSIVPFILFGPVTRTLEDASAFCMRGTVGFGCTPTPFSYLFISPFLYAQIAVYVLVFMVLGALMDRSTAARRVKLATFAGVLGAAAGMYGLVWSQMGDQFTALAHPAVVLGSCVLGVGVYWLMDKRGLPGPQRCIAGGGIAFLLPGLWLIGTWLAGHPWADLINGRLYTEATPYVLGLPLLTVVVVYAAGRIAQRGNPDLAAYTVPVNLGMLYGHMLDGFASFIAICSDGGSCTGARFLGLDLPSYGEKHPVSNLLLGLGNGWAFPVIKLGLVLMIIYVLDVEYRKDLQREPNLSGLVKLAIIVLGLAPGLRDYLRLAMGT